MKKKGYTIKLKVPEQIMKEPAFEIMVGMLRLCQNKGWIDLTPDIKNDRFTLISLIILILLIGVNLTMLI